MYNTIAKILCACMCIITIIMLHSLTVKCNDGIPTKELELMEKLRSENPRTKYTEREILLLNKIAVAEANTEGVEGMSYVIQTILNRVESDLFPNTIEEVIYQSGQFSTVGNGALEKAEPNAESQEALEKVNDFENRGQLFFESVSCENTWAAKNRHGLFTYNNHRFYI